MDYNEALARAREKMLADGTDSKTAWAIDTKRQRLKFVKGWGRVRELAGLPHGRAVLGRHA